MLNASFELFKQFESSAIVGFLVFLRVGAAMSLLPGFGERAIPMRVRLLLAVSFTAVVAPMIAPFGPPQIQPLLFFSETVSGLALGIFFRLFVFVLQLAGMMAAQATSLSQIFGGGASPDPLPAFGNLLVIAGLALAMMSGLHVKLAIALAQSYQAIPMGTFPNPAELTAWGVAGIGRSFSLAFSLAAPFLIASVIYNVAIGAINRAMPQLMVAFVGAPAITLGGLALLAVTSPIIIGFWLENFDRVLSDPFGGDW